MPQGYIARLVTDRGFGFIKGYAPEEDGTTPEWFFHRSECDALSPFDRMRVKDRVKFDEQYHDKGMRAVNVRLG